MCVQTAPDVSPIHGQRSSRRHLVWNESTNTQMVDSPNGTNDDELINKEEVAYILCDIAMLVHRMAELIARRQLQ